MSCASNSIGLAAVAIGNREYTDVCFHCQQQNVATGNATRFEVLASGQMRRRPVYFKELGDFLIALREGKKWQQAHAAARAKRRGLVALTRQVLLRLEKGQTKSPDPDALRAVAALYGVDYVDLVIRMMNERYGLGHDLPTLSSDSTEVTDPNDQEQSITNEVVVIQKEALLEPSGIDKDEPPVSREVAADAESRPVSAEIDLAGAIAALRQATANAQILAEALGALAPTLAVNKSQRQATKTRRSVSGKHRAHRKHRG